MSPDQMIRGVACQYSSFFGDLINQVNDGSPECLAADPRQHTANLHRLRGGPPRLLGKGIRESDSTFAMRNKMVEAKYNELLPQHAAAPAIHDL